MIRTRELNDKAKKIFPDSEEKRNAYIKGYIDGSEESLMPTDDSFFSTLADKLRELWPQGEKDGKYPWRASAKELKTRLEFIWKDRKLKDRYTIDQCLVAARRYLSQFESSTKYMQVLKYFVFKQDKIVGKDGKITYTYKSNFADLLEDNVNSTLTEMADLFESTVSLEEQGDLI